MTKQEKSTKPEILLPEIRVAGIDLRIHVVTENHVYLENPTYPSVAAGGGTTQEAINNFLALLPDLITVYALCDDDRLSNDALALKHYLLECFGAKFS